MEFGLKGKNPGELKSPNGIAIDYQTRNIVIIDSR